MESRPPLPPFDMDSARQKVRAAEDAWNTRQPEKVAGAYSEDSRWRNRTERQTHGSCGRDHQRWQRDSGSEIRSPRLSGLFDRS